MLKFLFRDNDVDVVVVQDGEENGAPGGGFNQAEDNSQVEFYFSPHLDPDADLATNVDAATNADSLAEAELNFLKLLSFLAE